MRSYPTQTTYATKQNTIANAASHFFLYSYIHACYHKVHGNKQRYQLGNNIKSAILELYCHEARYYSGWLGRWTAADPAGLVDGVNLYMYCRGNPEGMAASYDENFLQIKKGGFYNYIKR